MTEKAKPRAPASPPRRRFFKEMAGVAGSACLLATGVSLYSKQARALPPTAIRPPGALAEDDFLAACIRCGLCVRDCPFDTLVLSELGDGLVTGTPYFEARKIPCEMCDDIPCVVACPTGALDHALTDIEDARMGLGGTGEAYGEQLVASAGAVYQIDLPLADTKRPRRPGDERGIGLAIDRRRRQAHTQRIAVAAGGFGAAGAGHGVDGDLEQVSHGFPVFCAFLASDIGSGRRLR